MCMQSAHQGAPLTFSHCRFMQSARRSCMHAINLGSIDACCQHVGMLTTQKFWKVCGYIVDNFQYWSNDCGRNVNEIFFWYQWNLQERFHTCRTLSLPILMEIGTKFFVKGMSTWKTVIALQITQFKSKRSKIRPVVGFAWQGQILKNQLNRSVTGNFIPLWSWGR